MISRSDDIELAACPARLRPILSRCLRGDLSPAVALAQMLMATESVDRVAEMLQRVEAQATIGRRRNDATMHRLTQLVRLLQHNRPGASRIAKMLRRIEHAPADASPDAGIESCRALFDDLVRQCPEASVALYSLGDPDLLNDATAEVVVKLRDWKLLAADRSLLEIGCGIGRFQAALAGEVATVTGIDISSGMIEVARHRCAGLANVRLLQCSGRDLSLFDDAVFDMVFAVDTFPYLVHSGMPLAERHVHDAARVLRPHGDLLILNFSYRGDLQADREDVARLAAAAGFAMVRHGTREFALGDGLAFQLKRAD